MTRNGVVREVGGGLLDTKWTICHPADVDWGLSRQPISWPGSPNLSPGHTFFMPITSLVWPDLVWSRMTPSHFSSHYDIPLPVEAIINLFEIIQKCPAWAWPGAMSVWGVRNVIDVLYTVHSPGTPTVIIPVLQMRNIWRASLLLHLTPYTSHLTAHTWHWSPQ